jgi:hypothetical protein
MLKEMILLQSAGFFGSGAMADVLSKWEELGFFSYLLPFLLIFALIFGILTKTKIFQDNKIINGIIALAVALMALQFGFVSSFFSEVFPRLGVGLAIFLVLIILVSLFMDPGTKWVSISFFVVAVIIAGYVLIHTSKSLGWAFGIGFKAFLPEIIAFLVIVIFVIAVVAGGKQKSTQPYQPLGWFEPSTKS